VRSVAHDARAAGICAKVNSEAGAVDFGLGGVARNVSGYGRKRCTEQMNATSVRNRMNDVADHAGGGRVLDVYTLGWTCRSVTGKVVNKIVGNDRVDIRYFATLDINAVVKQNVIYNIPVDNNVVTWLENRDSLASVVRRAIVYLKIATALTAERIVRPLMRSDAVDSDIVAVVRGYTAAGWA